MRIPPPVCFESFFFFRAADFIFVVDEQSSIKMNLTIHKQIISLLEESGTVGMTLNVCLLITDVPLRMIDFFLGTCCRSMPI